MSVPNLPTDNMYKFLAIGGLLLCMVSLTLSVLILDSYSGKTINIYKQELAISKNLKETGLQLKTLTPEDLKNNDVLIRLYSRSLESGNENEAITKEVNIMEPSYKYKKTILDISTIFGLLLSTVGFVLWYQKLQKFEDIIIKDRASVS